MACKYSAFGSLLDLYLSLFMFVKVASSSLKVPYRPHVLDFVC